MLMEEVGLPRGKRSDRIPHQAVFSRYCRATPLRFDVLDAATVEKIVKDNLPKDIRLGTSTLDLLLECCGGLDCNANNMHDILE